MDVQDVSTNPALVLTRGYRWGQGTSKSTVAQSRESRGIVLVLVLERGGGASSLPGGWTATAPNDSEFDLPLQND